MRQNRVVDYLTYAVVRIFICVIQALRIETGEVSARWLAWLFGDVLRIRRGVIDENLAHAFPSLSAGQRQRLSRRMWEHLFLLVLEVAHAPRKIHETNWREYMGLNGVVPLVRILLSGRPVIIVTGHLGNFELGGFGLGVLGFPTYSVARPLDNRYLNDFLTRFRGATGQHLINKNGGYEQIEHVLSHGGAMAFLADQYAGEKGCWVEFFGRPASAYKAIALLAMEHQATVAVCASPRLGRTMRFEMVLQAMTDPRDGGDATSTVRDLTQWYTSQLEAAIRRDPGQYWWLHRRWKDTRKKRGERKKAA
jgi:KDO2-lipid IV(A) lauroyltransferase